MNRPVVLWSAERDGEVHAFTPRTRLTLCGIRVDERQWRPGLRRCAACSAIADGKEAASAKQ